MYLQQNLFSIYRLILRIPKFIFLLALAFAFVVVFTQIVYAYRVNTTVDLSAALQEYMLKKYEQKLLAKQASENKTTIVNQTAESNSSEPEPIRIYRLLDDATFLHIRESKDSKHTVTLNYTYSKGTSELPFIVLLKNEHLSYLKNSTPQYLQKHGISYDLITIPAITFDHPLFIYFFKQDMQKNQIILKSLTKSLRELDRSFNLDLLAKDIPGLYLRMQELYVSIYYKQDAYVYESIINVIQLLVNVQYPSLFVKFIFTSVVMVVVFASSVFVGLLIRYVVISVFTVYLAICDRCMKNNSGWLHQYLVLLYRRFRENKMTTLKMGFFYLLANVSMPLLLSFGAYCILVKAILPSLPLLTNQYVLFFLKTIFFIEVYHYIFSRTRTTLKYFPIISLIMNYGFLLVCCIRTTTNTMIMLNINLTCQFIAFLLFAMVEKLILEENQKGLIGEYCPTASKPRMLFYAGYDISWQRSIPPMFTYFTRWFDLSYFGQSQKCLIDRDYQLLYGRMQGFNERREIPQEDYQLREIAPGSIEQPSNQMHLIEQ